MHHTLMKMVVVMVVVIMMMGQSVAAGRSLLVNVLLNASQWGHRSQLQFQTQQL
jgi:hypothetical protein